MTKVIGSLQSGEEKGKTVIYQSKKEVQKLFDRKMNQNMNENRKSS